MLPFTLNHISILLYPTDRRLQTFDRFGFQHNPTVLFFGKRQIFSDIQFPRAKRHVVFLSHRIMKMHMAQMFLVLKNIRLIHTATAMIVPNIKCQSEHR